MLSVFPWQYMENGRPGSSIDRTFAFIEEYGPDLIGTHNLRAEPNNKEGPSSFIVRKKLL